MKFDINEKRKYQTVEGFGASGAWWAQIVGNWTHEDPVSGKPVRDRISELLFSKTAGSTSTAIISAAGRSTADAVRSANPQERRSALRRRPANTTGHATRRLSICCAVP